MLVRIYSQLPILGLAKRFQHAGKDTTRELGFTVLAEAMMISTHSTQKSNEG